MKETYGYLSEMVFYRSFPLWKVVLEEGFDDQESYKQNVQAIMFGIFYLRSSCRHTLHNLSIE